MAYTQRTFETGRVLVLDIETIVPDAVPGDTGFPKWPRHRPVVASMLAAEELDGQWSFRLNSFHLDEDGTAAFVATVERELDCGATIVTANGRGFDAAVLALTAMSVRSFDTPGHSKLAHANRFDVGHADLCELFSNYGAAPRPSLAEICTVLDIPVKLEADGAGVADLHAAGDIVGITRYCETDVAATYLAWLHWVAFRKSSAALFDTPLAAFAVWIERQGLSHLLPYAHCPAAQVARKRAPAHVAASLADRASWRVEAERFAAIPRSVINY